MGLNNPVQAQINVNPGPADVTWSDHIFGYHEQRSDFLLDNKVEGIGVHRGLAGTHPKWFPDGVVATRVVANLISASGAVLHRIAELGPRAPTHSTRDPVAPHLFTYKVAAS
ncbi:hypothetical protein D9613_011776 [Agrocybe pediades]|uniref:Uncharacterized protein n=1 Tax=Agrocybe pediades TaxID=84607 RepID=A0A8H4QKF4_9AGAR|nr:hypothetical protein D9613_011776 [Agrocybe pediades]